MHTGWKLAMAIVPGGLVAGAIIGAAADPRIKDPPPQWWQLAGNDTNVSSSNQVYAELGPYELNVHGGYRPDLDYDAEVWSLPLPDLDYAYYESDEYAPPVANPRPKVTEAETAADAAVAAADDAEVAQTEAPTEDARKAAIALNGIY